MTTVGFANDTPHTVLGKIIASVVMVFGFVLLALTTAAVASLFVREDEEAEEARLRVFEQNAMAELRQLHDRLDRIESQLRETDST